ncbi:MAG: NAD(P)H-hydrate dehydratase [Candidatus Aminicenantes bacterium]|nr:NAD(P)H-hydrate dehydratase [Candidatus Aminicenantes bacterium]
MKLLCSAWMQELDEETIKRIGIPSIVLMENAAQGAAAFFIEEFPGAVYRNVVVVIGKGNNGGDGIAVGRILHQKGYRVEFVLLVSPGRLNPDPAVNFAIIKNLNLHYSAIGSADELGVILNRYSAHDTFLVDAIFGTGIAKPVEAGLYADVIKTMNNSAFKIAAIDIPSGLSESFLPGTGEQIDAAATAALQSLKITHIYPDGNKYCGKTRIIDIGIPREFFDRDKYYIELIMPAHFKHLFQPREIDTHKGHYGHALNICGSLDKPGAGILSSYSALKVGAGLSTAAVCFENRTAAVTAHPEVMTLIYRENSDLAKRAAEFDAVLIGPGLGNTEATLAIVKTMIEHSRGPLVLDADALNVLQDRTGILKQPRDFPLVITPHPAEFSRIGSLPMKKILEDRIGVSRDFAGEYDVFVILKGHHTIIAAPTGQVYINQSGNPGMATAGSGDVLAGMLAGMIAQFGRKHKLDIILQAAVFVHGYAGDLAAANLGETSLTAADIIAHIPAAIKDLDAYKSPFQFSR